METIVSFLCAPVVGVRVEVRNAPTSVAPMVDSNTVDLIDSSAAEVTTRAIQHNSTRICKAVHLRIVVVYNEEFTALVTSCDASRYEGLLIEPTSRVVNRIRKTLTSATKHNNTSARATPTIAAYVTVLCGAKGTRKVVIDVQFSVNYLK